MDRVDPSSVGPFEHGPGLSVIKLFRSECHDDKCVSPMRNPNFDLRAWRQFQAVAEELHFGKAAARLHMTQPPLTHGIAALELALGVRLFDRTKRSVVLTPAGAALLPDVRDVLARARKLPVLARSAAAGELGRLRLALVSTSGFSLLPRWRQAFRTRCPEVQIELLEATGDRQLDTLAQGEIDAGILLHSPGFAPPGLFNLSLNHEPLVLAVPASSAWARTARLRVAALSAEPLVIVPRRLAPSLHDASFTMYHQAGAVPQVAQAALQIRPS